MAKHPLAPPALPSPSVRFAGDFRARLGRLVARLAAARERREGAGRAQLFGTGAEFVGYRPYRSGEDLRALDWNLLARLGRPYVRVSAREASEHWAVLLDTSASMGVGRPGKLQLGAELATALAALGVARGATVELWLDGEGPRRVARRRAALEDWMAFLTQVRAAGSDGLATWLAALARRSGAGRVFLVGDFLDLDGRELEALVRPSRELFLAQILAREEAAPELGPTRFLDAEGDGARAVLVDEARRQGYERRLAVALERVATLARRRAMRHVRVTSDTPFETLVSALCGGRGA